MCEVINLRGLTLCHNIKDSVGYNVIYCKYISQGFITLRVTSCNKLLCQYKMYVFTLKCHDNTQSFCSEDTDKTCHISINTLHCMKQFASYFIAAKKVAIRRQTLDLRRYQQSMH